LPELGIGGCPAQQARVLAEVAETDVAPAAKEKTQLARGVVMIDTKLAARFSLADRANAVLRSRQEVVVRLGQAVSTPQPSFGVGHGPLLGQGRKQELLLGLLLLIALAVGRLHLLPMLRIVGIALPPGRQRLLAGDLIVLAVGCERFFPVRRILGIALAPHVVVVSHGRLLFLSRGGRKRNPGPC